MLRFGDQQWEIYRRSECKDWEPITGLHDRFRARQWLQEFKGPVCANYLAAPKERVSGASRCRRAAGFSISSGRKITARCSCCVRQAFRVYATGKVETVAAHGDMRFLGGGKPDAIVVPRE